LKIVLANGTKFCNTEERIREYCDIEIYRGYDDCHNINDTIAIDDIRAANRLYANIGRFDATESSRILSCASISPLLHAVDDVDLGDLSSTGWESLKVKIRPLLKEFLSISGIGLPKAMKILHLKRPHLFPILDTFVVKFLTGIDITGSYKDRLLDIGMKALDIARNDIAKNRVAFEDLRRRLNDLLIPLTTVRMYDIICWTEEKWVNRGDRHAPYGIARRSVPPKTTGGVSTSAMPLEWPQRTTATYWVNVDKPTKTCTIHTDGICEFERGKYETPYKGIGKLKRDGGWLHFSSREEAQEYYNRIWASTGYRLIIHC